MGATKMMSEDNDSSRRDDVTSNLKTHLTQKLASDEQMEMMLAEERISMMMAYSQMQAAYGRQPAQPAGQFWPGAQNPLATFCPFPPQLLLDPPSSEPLDLRVPQKRPSEGERCYLKPAKRRLSVDQIAAKCAGKFGSDVDKIGCVTTQLGCDMAKDDCDIDKDRNVGEIGRIGRRRSSSRKSRGSPVPGSIVKNMNNNIQLDAKVDDCSNCSENRDCDSVHRFTNSVPGHAITPELDALTSELRTDEDIAERLFRPIDGNTATLNNNIEKPNLSCVSEQSSCGSEELLSNVQEQSDVTEVTENEDTVDVDDEDIDELRSENMAFKQMLANLSGEVDKLRQMMKTKESKSQ